MKNLILFFTTLFALYSSSLTAQQTKEQEMSNAEKFSIQSGTIIQKEYLEIGKIKGAEIKVIYYTDMIAMETERAVKFEYGYYSKYSSDTKTAVLDADEIDGLMKSIKLIQEKIFPTKASNYTEVSFKSRGGFEAGCFWKKDDWSAYLKLEKYDSDSYVFMGKEDFASLLSLLEQAKNKL